MRLYAECTHDNRRVTINRAYDRFTAALAHVNSNNVVVLRKTEFQGTYAVAEGWEDMSFQATKIGEWLHRSYRLQILIDPAGYAYKSLIH